MAQLVKNPPAMQETWVQSLSQIPWRRKWQPTPVFLSGKSHGQRSLVDYSPWDRKESDTTEGRNYHHQGGAGVITRALQKEEGEGVEPERWHHKKT